MGFTREAAQHRFSSRPSLPFFLGLICDYSCEFVVPSLTCSWFFCGLRFSLFFFGSCLRLASISGWP
jgi:hypothetical protein